MALECAARLVSLDREGTTSGTLWF
jgi:hypothetical protein